ncbi:MAG TPA: exodeoxyribonuclease VII small subunit [Clostridia bacterium]
MKFEEAMDNLNAIIKKLEDKDLELDEGIELYQKGLELAKLCLTSLEEAKGKITLIKNEFSKLIEEPFGREN